MLCLTVAGLLIVTTGVLGGILDLKCYKCSGAECDHPDKTFIKKCPAQENHNLDACYIVESRAGNDPVVTNRGCGRPPMSGIQHLDMNTCRSSGTKDSTVTVCVCDQNVCNRQLLTTGHERD